MAHSTRREDPDWLSVVCHFLPLLAGVLKVTSSSKQAADEAGSQLIPNELNVLTGLCFLTMQKRLNIYIFIHI